MKRWPKDDAADDRIKAQHVIETLEAGSRLDWCVDVIDREMLDEEHQKNFQKRWLVQYQDGTIEEYDTEEQACARQRALGPENQD